jgi:hypothetical protein
MGDPNAATDQGQWTGDPGILGWGSASPLNDLPEQAQEQLMRIGFIHIDISMARDRFAGPGQIARVEGNTVYLNVPEDSLI